MKYTDILLRYGEIFLKGKNRGDFERKLLENIKILTGQKVQFLRGRVLMDFFLGHHKLKTVFGLTSYSLAIKTEKEIEKIKQIALEMLKDKIGTFKVNTKRSDKQFPIESPQINFQVGKFVEENSSLISDYKNAEIILSIEINQQGAYLFFENISCFGGLPTGSGGKVAVLLENEASFLAGLLFMKRGCSILPFSFTKRDLSLLQKYSPQKLELKKITNLDELNVDVLVVGDTFDNTKKYSTQLLVFKPLIAYTPREIKEQLIFYAE